MASILSSWPRGLPQELKNLKMRDSVSTVATEESETELDISASSNEAHKISTSNLYQIPLKRINPSFGIVNVSKQETPLQKTMVHERRQTGSNLTVLFAVRHPGCGGCREHALQLSHLAQEDSKVRVVAAVKETGVDDQALLEFYQDYFHGHPIYKDEQWKIFKAMGGKKVCPFQLMRRASSLFKRTRGKGIESRVGKCDFWTKGGVLVFDKRGELKYAQYERFGKPFDMEAIRDAIGSIRAQRH